MPDQYGYSSAQEILPRLLSTLKEVGGDYVEADYSGGNDEGGVDDVRVYRRFEENGEEQKVEIEAGTGRWGDPIYDLCNEVMSSKYYTWAGEFYASGTLYVDAREKRVWTEGGETIDAPNPDYDEINVSL